MTDPIERVRERARNSKRPDIRLLLAALDGARDEIGRLRAEVATLRHTLQVAHDWMGRPPDNDCDEGGGFGAAHLAAAERTVVAALNGDCKEPSE